MENSKQTAFGYGFTTADGSSHVEEKGLTKREYFAAMAMQGIVSNQEFLKNLNAEPDLVVTGILEIADKLLERLSNGDGQ
jgi:hypothetical protein